MPPHRVVSMAALTNLACLGEPVVACLGGQASFDVGRLVAESARAHSNYPAKEVQ